MGDIVTSGNVFRATRYQPKKRVYRDCSGCGNQTWSPKGLCAKCSGKTAYRKGLLIHGPVQTHYFQQRAVKIWQDLLDTNDRQIDIAARHGVNPQTVYNIRSGRAHTGITGGYVLRPNERSKE